MILPALRCPELLTASEESRVLKCWHDLEADFLQRQSLHTLTVSVYKDGDFVLRRLADENSPRLLQIAGTIQH